MLLNLTRTEYDELTGEKRKINDPFEFPLELDMSKYISKCEQGQSQLADPDLYTYDLKAITMHSGGTMNGHYFNYIRDDLKEGYWDLLLPKVFDKKPQRVLRPGEVDSESEDAQGGKDSASAAPLRKAENSKPPVVKRYDYARCDFPVPYSDP